MHTVLLVFDIGTSGLKASLVDAHLNILRNVTTTYPTHHRPDGGVEQDAADWWMSAVRAMLMLRELVPEYLKQVDAIGVSGHMLGLLPMDREGQVLRPAMIRRDTRAKAVTETLLDRFGADYFYRISGNVLTPNLTLSKAVWLHENEPEVYEKTVRFLQCKDYLVYRLTGSMDTTDFSDASRAGLMNLQTRDYDYDMLETLSLHAEKFPTIRPGCAIAGHLTEEAAYHLGLRAGIPVSVGGGNGMCESVGAGVVSIGSYYMSLDTAAWIAGQTDTPFFDAQRRRSTAEAFPSSAQCAAQANASTGRRRFLTSAHPEPSMPPPAISLPAQTGLYSFPILRVSAPRSTTSRRRAFSSV